MTSFAFYVRDFFSNLFACCGGGGAKGAQDPNNGLRNSLNSSMHSNMLQYSFVAVPNHNSTSDSNNTVGLAKMRRSKIIRDFKTSANDKKDIFVATQQTDEDGEIPDGESDIIEDEDHIANAQRPL